MQLLNADSLFNACLCLFCLALLSWGTTGAADARPQPLRLKPGPYLFVDDYLIEECVNLTLNAPTERMGNASNDFCGRFLLESATRGDLQLCLEQRVCWLYL